MQPIGCAGGGVPPYPVKKLAVFNGLENECPCRILCTLKLAAESSCQRV
jgi:hypothetical protein